MLPKVMSSDVELDAASSIFNADTVANIANAADATNTPAVIAPETIILLLIILL